MPMLFPLAALCADALLGQLERGPAAARLGYRLALASVALAVTTCLATVTYFALASHRNNIALAQTLLRLRGPSEPVVFVGQYFFDVPLQARLSEPVPVLSDWHDAAIARHDNWKRELAEARTFAPELAARLLLDEASGLALRCEHPPVWAVVKTGDEAVLAALPGAARVAVVDRTALWRLGDDGCARPPP
jgi:hypothetical protein